MSLLVSLVQVEYQGSGKSVESLLIFCGMWWNLLDPW